MKRELSILFSILFVISFNCKSQDSFTIKGKIDTIPNAMYELHYLKYGESFVDTIYLDNNSEFIYHGNITEPTRISFGVDNKYDKRLVGYYTAYQFWIEPNSEIIFFGDKILKKKKVIGSKMELLDLVFENKLDSILAKNKDKLTVSNELDSLYESSINKNLHNYYAVWLTFSAFKNNRITEAFAANIYQNLNDDLRSTEVAKKIGKMLNLQIDKKFPTFNIPDINGEIYSSENFKGKYLLVDFWASWCPPCREESPYLKEAIVMYNKFGLEIVGISFDTNKANWIKAIEDDELSWIQLSDLKGMKSDLAKKYMIMAIPTNFLVDKNGVIIAKDLRKEELLDFLDKIFKQNDEVD